MEHLLLKAATTATDQGTFEAVISTATLDRDGDIVEPSAMVNALAKWAAVGKLVPLAWVHPDGKHTEDVVGHMDPASVRVEGSEVMAKGWVDQELERGKEAWRLIKSGTVSFSFGYLIPNNGAVKQPGGRFRIKELDVFEISLVPIGPANNDTRVLSWKSAEALREEATKVATKVTRELEEATLPELPPAPVEPTPEPDEPTVTVADIVTALKALGDEERLEVRTALGVPDVPDPVTQRERAKAVQREIEEQQIPEVEVEPEPEVDPVKELQEVKSQLAETRALLEDLMKKADVTDQAPTRARSVDPLRKQAEAVALDVAAGMRLPAPPTTQTRKPPEPSLSLKELRERTRQEMLGVLSGGNVQ